MEQIGTKSDRLALALAEGENVQAAAEKAGIGRTTAYRRLADPAFRQRIHTLRGGMIGDAVGRMAAGMSEAAGVLRDLLKAESEPIRLAAARALLDVGVKLRQAVDTEDRVTALESRLADGKQDQ